MGSPLSAVHRDQRWRILGMQILVVGLTLLIGAGFFFSTRYLIQMQAANQAKQIADVISYGISQNYEAMQALHSENKEPTRRHLLNLIDRVPQATSLKIAQKTAQKTDWLILASTRDEEVGSTVTLPTVPELQDELETVVLASGSTLTTVGALYDAAASAPTIIVLETKEAFFMQMVKTFLPPCILLLLACIFILRLVKSYLHAGKSEVKRQIDSNRLALLELATHQLGAPLATFRWWHELLSDPDGKELLNSPEILAQISQAVDRMDKIVKAMTEANHVESGGVAMNIEVLKSLKHILQRVMDDARPLLTQRKQRLEIYLDPKLEPVQIDTKLIFGILQELIDNAIHYSPDNTVITVRANKDGKQAEISIADQGYGIPEEDLIHIGEKFTRASNAAQHKPVGNGLGLFIAKGIIQNCGGDLWVESKLGRGTTVHFTLPFDTSGGSDDAIETKYRSR